jgi:hypothetical protein
MIHTLPASISLLTGLDSGRFPAGSSPGTLPKLRSTAIPAAIVRRLKCCSRLLKLDRLLLRGLSGPNDEFLLAATAQNLRKKVAKLRGQGPPDCNIGVPARREFVSINP